MSADSVPFWRTKTLGEMSEREWESLCDGCGRCCLVKLEEDVPGPAPAGTGGGACGGGGETAGRIFFTDVGCRLLDDHTCGCRDYPNRSAAVPDCVRLTPAVVKEIGWLPPTCAYRLVAEGRDLYWWHPLVSGDRETVHMAGVSVRGRVAASETEVAPETIEEHIVSWPLRVPRRARGEAAPPGCRPSARQRRLPAALPPGSVRKTPEP